MSLPEDDKGLVAHIARAPCPPINPPGQAIEFTDTTLAMQDHDLPSSPKETTTADGSADDDEPLASRCVMLTDRLAPHAGPQPSSRVVRSEPVGKV